MKILNHEDLLDNPLPSRSPIPSHVRTEVKGKFGGSCAYCGLTLEDKFHVDHVVPFAKGGPDDPINLFPTCASCNSMKSDCDLHSFRLLIENYHLKHSTLVVERFGSIAILGPVCVVFEFERQGYVFPEALVKSMVEANKWI